MQLLDGQVDLFHLLTMTVEDWEYLDIRKEKSADGGVVTIVIPGNMEQTPEKTYYEHTYEFHLNKHGRLVGVVEYTFADTYMNFLGTEGRFDMKSWSHVTFPAAKVLDIETKVQTAVDDVQAALADE